MRYYMIKEYDFDKLVNDEKLLDDKIVDFVNKGILKQQKVDLEEIKGHFLKAENNLRFVSENLRLGFLDWSITGCYYACYHAAMSLILTKNYSSKNHMATLCILIKEFYQKELNKDDLKILSEFMDYQDLLFYVESKNKREDATYSTNTKFDKKEVEQLRIKAALFVTKAKSILNI